MASRSRKGGIVVISGLLLLPIHIVGQTSNGNVLEPAELSMHWAINTVVVPVQLNGDKPIQCILDTGMPEGLFVMRPASVTSANLQYSGVANVQGVGSGSMLANVAMGATLSAGGTVWQGQRVIVLQAPGRLAHLGVDGAIGGTLFANRTVQFDFENEVVRLFEPDQFDPDQAGQAIAVVFEDDKPYVAVNATIGGKKVELNLLLDTGANKGLSINPSSTAQFLPPEPVISTYVGSGVGGDIQGSLGRVDLLRIGSFEIKDVAASFPDQRGVDGDGSIGMELLRKFLLTIDYLNQRIFLKPNDFFEDPTDFTMTGMSIIPDALGRLRVHSVIPQSPADLAGVKVGDVVEAANGRRVNFAGYCHDLHLSSPGKELTLRLNRGGQRLDITVVLRRIR